MRFTEAVHEGSELGPFYIDHIYIYIYMPSLCEPDAVVILIVNKYIRLICQCTAEKLTSHSFAEIF